ncbi:hypothetical protein KKA66_03950, partial [Patescibacteria group bacterium]|nr:hypothetical protein [Patescibacteria group bacterium]
MKKLIIFLVMSFILAGTSSAQKLKKYTYKCTFELGSAVVSKHDSTMLSYLADTLKFYPDLEPWFYSATDAVGYKNSNKNLSDAKNGGLNIARI